MNAQEKVVLLLPNEYLRADKTQPGYVQSRGKQSLQDLQQSVAQLARSGKLNRQQIKVFRDPKGSFDPKTKKCSKTKPYKAFLVAKQPGETIYAVYTTGQQLAFCRQRYDQPAANIVMAHDDMVIYDIGKVLAKLAA